MEGDIAKIIKCMTLEEKAGMCSGANWFETKSIERLGISRMQMLDGPNGLRKNFKEIIQSIYLTDAEIIDILKAGDEDYNAALQEMKLE